MERPGHVAARSRSSTAQGDARVASGNATDDCAPSADFPSSSPQASLSASAFPKDRRIRRRSEFGTVFDRGTRLHSRFFTFLVLPNRLAGSRLGIVTSRKFGGAVQRNRAKRLIREMFRQLGPQPASAAVDLVVIPRREMLAAEFPHLAKDFGHTWRRGIERLSANRRG